jgi:hypothetical protein
MKLKSAFPIVLVSRPPEKLKRSRLSHEKKGITAIPAIGSKVFYDGDIWIIFKRNRDIFTLRCSKKKRVIELPSADLIMVKEYLR